MEMLARLAHGVLHRVSFETKLPEPEQINYKPRPVTGFFANLTPQQQERALAYRGPENIGEAELRLDAKA